ncbi:BAZ2A isoform 9, partial [Pongo abelii]
LADDSQTSTSIFASPTSPSVLGESVLQDNSFDLNNGSDAEQEEMETQSSDFPPSLTQPAPDQSSTIQLHPATSPAVSPTTSPAVSLVVSPAASPEISPEVCPTASTVVSAAVFSVVSPASSAVLPAVSSEIPLTASVTSPKASPVTSPAAAFPTASPANKDVSSFLETTADLEEITGEGLTTSGSGDVMRRRIATPEEVRLPLQHGAHVLLWQVAERGAHQEGQPPMAGGDLVLWPLWEEDEAISRSDQVPEPQRGTQCPP